MEELETRNQESLVEVDHLLPSLLVSLIGLAIEPPGRDSDADIDEFENLLVETLFSGEVLRLL